jgi:hypothetical protein
MNRHKKSPEQIARDRKNFREWKERKDIALKAIPLEVDLENREIFLGQELKAKLDFELLSNNVDRLISSYVDPCDSGKVQEGLELAQHGTEHPITFNFIHPRTSERMQFEYRYEIVYVRYASTRLNGVLVNIRDQKTRGRRTNSGI